MCSQPKASMIVHLTYGRLRISANLALCRSSTSTPASAMTTDSARNLDASSAVGGSSVPCISSILACGNAMELPRNPFCRPSLGPRRDGSAMTLFTHMRPLANDFTSISCSGSPQGAIGKGLLPIQLSFASAYLGMKIFLGESLLRDVPHS